MITIDALEQLPKLLFRMFDESLEFYAFLDASHEAYKYKHTSVLYVAVPVRVYRLQDIL